MTDKDKKPNFVLWILIGIGVVVVLLGIAIYMLLRKITSLDIRIATMDKTMNDLRVKSTELEQKINTKDEKYQALQVEFSQLREKNTEFKYKLKDLNSVGKSVSKKNACIGPLCEDIITDLE